MRLLCPSLSFHLWRKLLVVVLAVRVVQVVVHQQVVRRAPLLALARVWHHEQLKVKCLRISIDQGMQPHKRLIVE